MSSFKKLIHMQIIKKASLFLLLALSLQCTTAHPENTYIQTVTNKDGSKQQLRLTIGNDMFYRLIVMYEGANKMPDAFSGKYTRDKDIVKLNGIEHYQYFNLTNSKLQWCTANGTPINNVGTDKVIVSNSNLSASQTDVSFFALGQEPGWNLTIDLENKITFSKSDGTLIKTQPVKIINAMDANVKQLTAVTENATLNVTWQQSNCNDIMSGEMFDYTVSVTLTENNKDKRTYNGCGKYLLNENINGRWYLTQLKNEYVNHSILLKPNPELIFDASNKQFTGHAGCNQFSGKLFIDAKTLRFDQMMSTEMACNDGGFENRCMQALRATTKYEIKGGLLYLSNPNEITLTYSRKENEMKNKNTLNNTWQLKEINSKAVEPDNYMKGLPQITLNTDSYTYNGHAGCNLINGKFKTEGNKITVLPGPMTRMACPGNGEDEFVEALLNVTSYTVTGNLLTLFKNDIAVIVFKLKR